MSDMIWSCMCGNFIAPFNIPDLRKSKGKTTASITYHIQSSVSYSASLANLSEFKICCFTVLKWAVPEDTVWRLIGLTAAVSWVSLLVDLRHLLCSSDGTAGQTEGLGRGETAHGLVTHCTNTRTHTCSIWLSMKSSSAVSTSSSKWIMDLKMAYFVLTLWLAFQMTNWFTSWLSVWLFSK